MSSDRDPLDSDDEPYPVEAQKVTPRVRFYQDGPGKEWIVFFRPKNKPLNAMRISKDLWNYYLGVTDVTKLHQNKIRVTVNNQKEANEIVVDQRFCLEYRVWIPARLVEIDGVVTEGGLTMQQVLKGVGHFKRRNLPTVQVIEARQMGASEGGRFIPSHSFRITFAGTALPDYLVINNVLRLPVRLYRPRVMSCTNCKKLGHTATFCSNKTVCGKCGGKHPVEGCQKLADKCLLCGGAPHEARSCPTYKDRSKKLKLELTKRSKQSFAEIVKLAAATTKDGNPYAALSSNEADMEQESEDELSFHLKTCAPKRKRKYKDQPKVNRKRDQSRSKNIQHPASGDFNREFPLLESKRLPSKVSTKLEDGNSQQHDRPTDIRISFPWLLDMIFSGMSSPVKELLEPLIPVFKTVGRGLIENSALGKYFSFDD